MLVAFNHLANWPSSSAHSASPSKPTTHSFRRRPMRGRMALPQRRRYRCTAMRSPLCVAALVSLSQNRRTWQAYSRYSDDHLTALSLPGKDKVVGHFVLLPSQLRRCCSTLPGTTTTDVAEGRCFTISQRLSSRHTRRWPASYSS